ncbi:MAG: ABC transporter ATP-binding protein [Deltaproteobacteria bacterium]|jgi:ABC-type dipeptide/oligopeptide/nickel transport system ATPase component|nr:ABC transporter ATP-binding protein [Deltaproteobacteria bacterium]
MSAFLELHNLTVRGRRDGRLLVNDLSLSIERGERLAIVGESGSGKTMTSMAVMNLLPNSVEKLSGTVIIDGKNTDGWGPERWRQMRNMEIAMVLQNPMSAFDPVASIKRHFQETMSSHLTNGADQPVRESALSALKEAGFPKPEPVLDLFPFQMSGGMLQRVMVALAMIGRPSLIIADEATTDLDVVSQAQILRKISELSQDRNMGLLLITHDLSVAASMAKEVMVMQKGEVVERGALTEVFENPSNEYTKGLMKAHFDLYTTKFKRFMCSLEGSA